MECDVDFVPILFCIPRFSLTMAVPEYQPGICEIPGNYDDYYTPEYWHYNFILSNNEIIFLS